jgi:hypothetical protein
MSAAGARSITLRAIWLALIILTAGVTAVGAAILAWIGGTNPPLSVLTGGGTFGGTIVILLTMIRYAEGPQS